MLSSLGSGLGMSCPLSGESADDISSNLPVVQNTIVSLQTQVQQYSVAVKSSVNTANSGARFAEQAQQLCTYLLDKSTPEYRIIQHINEMKVVARQAQQEAQSTSASFREARRGFNEVIDRYYSVNVTHRMSGREKDSCEQGRVTSSTTGPEPAL